jgi:hypothetical protein
MKTVKSFQFPRLVSFTSLKPILVGILSVLLTSCGSQMMHPIPPQPGGTTKVTVLLTTTANDQLVEFFVTLSSLSLTDKSGNSVVLFNNNPNAANSSFFGSEFMHLNGASEPLVTTKIPQGTYTSATLTVMGCEFTNITVDSSTGGLDIATFAQGLCAQGTGATTMNLAAPITIGGAAAVLSLDFQVAQSFTLTNNGPSQQATYTISPVFNLAPLTLSARPTNEQNGLITGLDTVISSVQSNGSGFVEKTADGFSLDVVTNASTAFQGIDSFSSLIAGTPGNIDVAIQPDGSLVATRVEVDDITVPAEIVGPFLQPTSQPGVFTMQDVLFEGCVPLLTPFCGNIFEFGNTTAFNISGQFTNLGNLPFTPAFNGSILVPGQNVSIFSNGTFNQQGAESASTITLAPQTLNGTVTAVSSSGGFNVYTITLASYDLFPVISATPGPFVHPPSPTTVTVYADTDTQLLTTMPIGMGSLARFRGVVFNDDGALRMDCGQILDGVPE